MATTSPSLDVCGLTAWFAHCQLSLYNRFQAEEEKEALFSLKLQLNCKDVGQDQKYDLQGCPQV